MLIFSSKAVSSNPQKHLGWESAKEDLWNQALPQRVKEPVPVPGLPIPDKAAPSFSSEIDRPVAKAELRLGNVLTEPSVSVCFPCDSKNPARISMSEPSRLLVDSPGLANKPARRRP